MEEGALDLSVLKVFAANSSGRSAAATKSTIANMPPISSVSLFFLPASFIFIAGSSRHAVPSSL